MIPGDLRGALDSRVVHRRAPGADADRGLVVHDDVVVSGRPIASRSCRCRAIGGTRTVTLRLDDETVQLLCECGDDELTRVELFESVVGDAR